MSAKDAIAEGLAHVFAKMTAEFIREKAADPKWRSAIMNAIEAGSPTSEDDFRLLFMQYVEAEAWRPSVLAGIIEHHFHPYRVQELCAQDNAIVNIVRLWWLDFSARFPAKDSGDVH